MLNVALEVRIRARLVHGGPMTLEEIEATFRPDDAKGVKSALKSMGRKGSAVELALALPDGATETRYAAASKWGGPRS